MTADEHEVDRLTFDLHQARAEIDRLRGELVLARREVAAAKLKAQEVETMYLALWNGQQP